MSAEQLHGLHAELHMGQAVLSAYRVKTTDKIHNMTFTSGYLFFKKCFCFNHNIIKHIP
jgi:hypothetical protein